MLREEASQPLTSLFYLVSTKRLQVLPVSDGGKVSAARTTLATSLHGRWDQRAQPHLKTASNLLQGTWDHGDVQMALCLWGMGYAPAQLMEVGHPRLSACLTDSWELTWSPMP